MISRPDSSAKRCNSLEIVASMTDELSIRRILEFRSTAATRDLRGGGRSAAARVLAYSAAC